MKKKYLKTAIIVVCLMWLCFTVIGCSSQISTEKPPLTSTDASTQTPISSEEPSHSIEIPLYYIYDLDEYRAYIASSDFPDTFIHYDGFSKLGEFVTFGYNPEYKYSYWYVLRNGTEEFMLGIDPKSQFKLPENDAKDVLSVNNLMTVKSDCAAQIGTAWYHFNNGVSLIYWMDDTYLFELSGFEPSAVLQANTLISRLLYRDTAPAALEELRQDIAKQQSRQ